MSHPLEDSWLCVVNADIMVSARISSKKLRMDDGRKYFYRVKNTFIFQYNPLIVPLLRTYVFVPLLYTCVHWNPQRILLLRTVHLPSKPSLYTCILWMSEQKNVCHVKSGLDQRYGRVCFSQGLLQWWTNNRTQNWRHTANASSTVLIIRILTKMALSSIYVFQESKSKKCPSAAL